jgi:hypothetical protein
MALKSAVPGRALPAPRSRVGLALGRPQARPAGVGLCPRSQIPLAIHTKWVGGFLSFARCGSTAVGPLPTAPVARGLVERGSALLSVVSRSVALRLRKRGGGRLLGHGGPLRATTCGALGANPALRGRVIGVGLWLCLGGLLSGEPLGRLVEPNPREC